MRTTLDLDADVLQAARELAQRDRKTIGTVLSELARQTLLAPRSIASIPALRNGVPVLARRNEVVTQEFVKHLLEDEPS